ncbi:MAG: Nif3-like dinuclear metal center hexameric protein [Planctomycetia bacterium]|nr:Nif3-like dinuclear metal center hexameric protein [Planctomycetia bacterium]
MARLLYITDFLEKVFPLSLAEDWDNVGLLLGERGRVVRKVMTCLTVSQGTVAEAIDLGVDLILSHHPFPFRAEKKWTSATTEGRILMALMKNGIAVYSPHTAHDSAATGINEQLAQGLGLAERGPLYPAAGHSTSAMYEGMTAASPAFEVQVGSAYGTGRVGHLKEPVSLHRFINQCADLLHISHVLYAGNLESLVRKVALGCGAADDFLTMAVAEHADVFLTGEARFHNYVAAENESIALVAPGHYATERFAMETLAKRLAHVFPGVTVTAARTETDPVRLWSPS